LPIHRYLSDYEEPSDAGSPGVIVYGYDRLPIRPVDPYVEAALQAPGQAPPSPDYVPGPEHPPSPDYVPEPEYPEYLVSSDAKEPMKDQPLPDDALPAALSPGYIADFDPEEDPEEEPVDYPADGRDDTDDESSDDDDEEEEQEQEASEDGAEEEEDHPALANSSDVPVVDPVPSAEETEPFETDESTATPPPPHAYHTTSRMFVQTHTPISFPSEVEVARLLALPTWWVPARKIFTSSTTMVESEPPCGSNTDITNLYECIQNLDSCAGTSINVQEEQNLDLNADAPFNLKKGIRSLLTS
nr:hypothetical protein [Tanacetum cinerariifolium]